MLVPKREFPRTIKRQVDTYEDAPPGHICYQMIRLKSPVDGERQPFAVFRFHSRHEGEVLFQVTTQHTNGSREHALRIARLCYMKFEEGATKDEVFMYRHKLFQQMNPQAGQQDR